MSAFKIVSIILIAMCFLAQNSVQARMPDSNSELKNVIRRAEVLPQKSQFSVAVNVRDKTVTVSAYTSPTNPDKNLIIDSVLISKTIIDKFDDVGNIRCMYYHPSRISYRYLIVPRSIVDQFGAGKLSKEQLFDGLKMIEVKTSKRTGRTNGSISAKVDSYIVKGNMQFENRSNILTIIRSLKNSGVDVSPYFTRFMEIERKYVAQDRDRDTVIALKALNNRLKPVVAKTNERVMAESMSARNKSGSRPAAGMFADRRNAIMARMNQLQQEGRDISQYWKAYNSSVKPLVDNPRNSRQLDKALSLMENMLRIHR